MTNNKIDINTINLINVKSLTSNMLTRASREIEWNGNEIINAIMKDRNLNKDDAKNVLIKEYKKLLDIVTKIFTSNLLAHRNLILVNNIRNKYDKLITIIQEIIVDDFEFICQDLLLYAK